jgi:hypothetical protein
MLSAGLSNVTGTPSICSMTQKQSNMIKLWHNRPIGLPLCRFRRWLNIQRQWYDDRGPKTRTTLKRAPLAPDGYRTTSTEQVAC